MNSTITRSALRAAPAKAAPSRSMPPVRLPQSTADLVNRMLTARCSAAH